jgi:2-oxoglutarate ferredoxin oxidoreductase subunit gamma
MELIFSGFGGQGILTAGLIVAYAGNEMGKKVLWSPSYGSEMRGGTANCSVTISDEEIGSPSLPECDALIAMNRPSLDKFKNTVRKGGCIIVNQSIIPKDYAYPEGVYVHKVNATEISNACENKRGANLVMLGVLCKATGLFSLDCIIRQTDSYFAEKGKTNLLNAACIRAGYEQSGE